MFTQASVRLAAWYIAILMSISLLFSGLIYQSAISEVQSRFSAYTTRLNAEGYHIVDYEKLQDRQLEQAKHNILVALVLINLTIGVVGGVASFFLAKRTLKPIKEAHEIERRFIGDASHELRTPLAVMKTEIEVALRDKSTTKNEMRELLTSNLDEVNRLAEMSRALLSLSKRDYTTLEFTNFDIVELVNSIINKSADYERFKLSLPKKSIEIKANQPSIVELCMIMLDNARKHSPADTTINVRIKSQSRSVSLIVTNRGPGIAKDDISHIFERFYRADRSRSGSEGFGLGLSLAKQITELHNGSISANSTVNKTTSFTVNLPRN